MVYTKFQLSLLLLILENVTFSKTMEAPSEEKCWQTRPEQHRSPNSDSSQTLLGTVYNKRNVKMQNESTRKSRKEPQEGPCTHWKSINQFRAGSILWMKQSDKKVSFHGPQNGGHFSCGKPVPHLRTSPVSDSEAVIHLAHVQHLWQSKLFVIFLVLARWRIRLCSELQRARQWLHMHFVMHVCWKKLLCRWALAAKIFPNFAPCFGPQNGGWKMDPKMVPEFDPQNGGPKMAPKMGSKNGTQKIVKMKIKLWFLLDQDIGPPFGCHFWTSILGVKFWHHFWVHFSTPILGSKTWCKICKNFCCQSSSA